MTLSGQSGDKRFSLFAKHAAKYYTVGASGVLVNLGLLYSLTEYVGLWYIVSYVIAISVSITSNFTFNKFWTFREVENTQRTLVIYVKFVTVSILGMGIQLGTAYVLVEWLLFYYMLAAIISIGLAGGINFIINRRWTFGVKF